MKPSVEKVMTFVLLTMNIKQCQPLDSITPKLKYNNAYYQSVGNGKVLMNGKHVKYLKDLRKKRESHVLHACTDTVAGLTDNANTSQSHHEVAQINITSTTGESWSYSEVTTLPGIIRI